MEVKLLALWPEISLFITTCIVMVVGLSPRKAIRDSCPILSAVGLLVAGILAITTTPVINAPFPSMAMYGKALVAGIGLLLLLVLAGTTDREFEAGVSRGKVYDAIRATRAEFYSFFLFSLTGLMLCAGADDLIWLFLALELTSLPTYVMVTISTARNRSLEAGVKYFFLGALGAAIFLYGFAMIYGGTGSTNLMTIQSVLQAQSAAGGINTIAMLGLILAVIGMCFKIAAVPMHFYTPDVYQGAASPVAAFLAFVPKAAGFFGIMLVVATAGWTTNAEGVRSLPAPLHATLWVIAVCTMTFGNVLAILQTSVKRILAYSSIAHSGYMLVGVIAGPAVTFASSGIAAVLFYLLCYGVMNLGAFAVIASLERRGADGVPEEPDDLKDIRGLCRTHPVLGWTMVISAVGLLGLPPFLGFFGKLPLFSAGIAANHFVLVIILGINSAIAAYYYLRLAAFPLLEQPEKDGAPTLSASPYPTRRVAGVLSAVGVIVLAFYGSSLFAQRAATAATTAPAVSAHVPPAEPGHAQH
jgi:NADH-quinone oxidoreductase subunit N